jgi:hypothetical protein
MAQSSSPTCRSFLLNHLTDIAAIDMFVVTTATFQLLYALIVLGHDRRKVIHVAVTHNPAQVWLAQQMTEAFSWETTPAICSIILGRRKCSNLLRRHVASLPNLQGSVAMKT